MSDAARSESQGPAADGPDARVAVVVITRDRVRELLATLDRLRRLPERPKVVVVDNGSSDGTCRGVTEQFPEMTLLSVGRNLGAAGRNLGVAHLSTPYVAFCDDDTWWDPGCISRAANLLDAHPRLAVVTARILVEPGGQDDPICAEMQSSPLPVPSDLPGRPILSFLAGASVLRRTAFVEAGGFNDHLFMGGEEELLASDLASRGWAMAYVPACVVHHRASRLREPDLRRRQGIRNTLWTTWLRRPPLSAARRTARLVRSLPVDQVSAKAVAEAVAGIPWVLRHRRVVPPEVERGLRLLDGPQLSSSARQYVS